MKLIITIILAISPIFAFEASEKLFECTEIFKERKSELLVELERIDEQKQALSALKIATQDLLTKRETALSQKEAIVEEKLDEITQKEKSIKEMLVKNEEILKESKSLKKSKISQTFAKMKASAASKILEGMQNDDAVQILSFLKPKIVGQILTKMDAQKASELTLLLSK